MRRCRGPRLSMARATSPPSLNRPGFADCEEHFVSDQNRWRSEVDADLVRSVRSRDVHSEPVEYKCAHAERTQGSWRETDTSKQLRWRS
jgi:hypothetical protein